MAAPVVNQVTRESITVEFKVNTASGTTSVSSSGPVINAETDVWPGAITSTCISNCFFDCAGITTLSKLPTITREFMGNIAISTVRSTSNSLITVTGSFTEDVVIWYLPLLIRNLLTISFTAVVALYEKYSRESLSNVGDSN